MAKPKKITGDTEISITPKSKSAVYQYDGTGTYTFTINTGFTTASGKEIGGYEGRYNNFAMKNGDDLVVTTLFTKNNGSVKTVKTTIKGYFINQYAENSVEFKSYSDYDKFFDITSPVSYSINPSTPLGRNGLFKSGVSVEDDVTYLMGSTEGNEYEFDNDYSTYVYDVKGDDTYETDRGNSQTNIREYIWDMAGSDEYTKDDGGLMYVSDYKGNDEYTARYYLENGATSRVLVEDYAGNDTYDLQKGSAFLVQDYKGNDGYTVKNVVKGESEIYINAITDQKGNDTYEFENAEFRVNDYGGKDTYTIKSSKEVDITDEGKGNDTYDISNCTGIGADIFGISDAKGNETYTLSNVKFVAKQERSTLEDDNGNDTYDFTDVANVSVTDHKGNDKYYLSQGIGINYVDFAGNDKYEFTLGGTGVAIDDINITDYKGKDNYTLTGRKEDHIETVVIDDEDKKSKDKYTFAHVSEFDVTDEGGSDVYNVTCGSGTIKDKLGNDSYTFSEMFSTVEIVDGGGNKDKLVISDATQDKVIFMANMSSTGYADGSLFMYNTESDTFIKIDDFFTTDGSGITGFDSGRIETIKFGKTTMKDINKTAGYEYFNSLNEAVAGWIENSDYGSVEGILTDSGETADAAKAAMVAYFTGNGGSYFSEG